MTDTVVAREGVVSGQPCFAGTRVPVDVLFVNLAAGHPLAVILDDYPTLDAGQARAALREALALLRGRAIDRSDLSRRRRREVGEAMYGHDWTFGTPERTPAQGRRPEAEARNFERVPVTGQGEAGEQTFLRWRVAGRGDPALFTRELIPVAALTALMRAGWGDAAILALPAFAPSKGGGGVSAGELAVIRSRPDLFGRSLPFARALDRLRATLTAHARAHGGLFLVWLPWRERPRERPLPALLQGTPVPPHPAEGPADLAIVGLFPHAAEKEALTLAMCEAARLGLSLTDGFAYDGSFFAGPDDPQLAHPDETWGDRP